jgi:hypothetical protein
MKIIDKNGNALTEKPDLTAGRLEQGEQPDTLVYKTWTDFPPTDAEGNPIDMDKPTAQDKLEAQVNYTAMMTDTMLPDDDEEE